MREVLHIIYKDKVLSILLGELKRGVEYTVEVDKGAAVRVRLGDSIEVEGAKWFYVQSGSELWLYNAEDGTRKAVAAGEVGDSVRALYAWRNRYPIAAYAWIEYAKEPELPVKPLWLPGVPMPIYVEVGPPPAVVEKGAYLVVSADGRTVAAKAACASMLKELGLKYEAGGEYGRLNPVYRAEEDGRQYAVVCLTCLRGFEWAVAFRRVRWARGFTEYGAEIFTPNGYLAYGGRRLVEVPGYGEVDLEEEHERADEQCRRYLREQMFRD